MVNACVVAETLYFLDSNICIYLLKGLSPEAGRRLSHARPGSVVISSVSLAEIMVGLSPDDGPALAAMEKFLAAVPSAAFDEAAARMFGRLGFRRGKFDRLIAAHILSRDAVLVTNNERDFAGIEGLKIENWTLPL